MRSYSATVLTWVSATGVIGTAVLAARATPKAEKEEGSEMATAKIQMVNGLRVEVFARPMRKVFRSRRLAQWKSQAMS